MKKAENSHNIVCVGSQILVLDTPKVMGILNVTSDSFYSASRCTTEDEILARIHQIAAEGAAIVDIGAYSTRPNADDVPQSVEIERISMAMDIVKRVYPEIIVSIDTFRSAVVREIVHNYGKIIVNDISGGNLDAKMFETIAELDVPYILTHSRGAPKTMQHLTNYDDLLNDIVYWFSQKIKHLQMLGVCDIIVDPGFGFAKTPAQSIKLLSHLTELGIFSMPIIAGVSRKSMIYKTLDSSPADALTGTIVFNYIALQNGASILRVHDVKEANEVIKLYEQIKLNY
jgi:dihydropteroate synthase